jgi:hypothetical protein
MVEITYTDLFGEAATARIDWGTWTSKDDFLLALCKLYTLDHPYTSIPSNPDPDYDVAHFVAEKIGATITHADEPDFVDGRIY